MASPFSKTTKTSIPLGALGHHGHREQPVAAAELHPGHAEVARPIGRSASSVAVNRTDIPLAADQEQVVSRGAQVRPDQLVAVAEVHRDEAAAARRVVPSSRVFFTNPARVASTRYGACVVVDGEHRGDGLSGLEGEQVRDMLTLGVPSTLGQLVRLGPVDPAEVGEEEQPVVGRRGEEVGDDILVAQLGTANPLAAAPLGAVLVDQVRLA